MRYQNKRNPHFYKTRGEVVYYSCRSIYLKINLIATSNLFFIGRPLLINGFQAGIVLTADNADSFRP
ncbi:MAG: hypothetical protein ACK504_01660 [Bacteroidota bacterium]